MQDRYAEVHVSDNQLIILKTPLVLDCSCNVRHSAAAAPCARHAVYVQVCFVTHSLLSGEGSWSVVCPEQGSKYIALLRREGLNYETAKVECGCSQLVFT